MIAAVRAELFRLSRWPATWIIAGAWLVLNATFGYVFPYLSYRDAGGGGVDADTPAAVLRDQLLPSNVPTVVVQGLPMFGGALVLILAALAVGSGYGWGTWKTVFTTGPGRLRVWGGTVAALGVVLAAIVLLSGVVDLAGSLVVSAVESWSVSWPSAGDVLEGLGSAMLITAMWAAGGVLLGTLTRGPALASGLGLVWVLVVENLLRAVAGVLDALATVTDVLPGTAAGSLAGVIAELAEGEPGAAPGVLTTLGGGSATALLGAYVVVFLGIAAVLTARRDVTS